MIANANKKMSSGGIPSMWDNPSISTNNSHSVTRGVAGVTAP